MYGVLTKEDKLLRREGDVVIKVLWLFAKGAWGMPSERF